MVGFDLGMFTGGGGSGIFTTLKFVFGIAVDYSLFWVPVILILVLAVIVQNFRRKYRILSNVWAVRGNSTVRLIDFAKIVTTEDAHGKPIRIMVWLRHKVPSPLSKRNNLYVGPFGFFVSDFRETADGIRLPIELREEAGDVTLKARHAGLDMWVDSYEGMMKHKYEVVPPLKWYQNPVILGSIGIVAVLVVSIIIVKIFSDGLGTKIASMTGAMQAIADGLKNFK